VYLQNTLKFKKKKTNLASIYRAGPFFKKKNTELGRKEETQNEKSTLINIHTLPLFVCAV
jgi:hypothetical protein